MVVLTLFLKIQKRGVFINENIAIGYRKEKTDYDRNLNKHCQHSILHIALLFYFFPSTIGTKEKLSNTSSLIAPLSSLVTRFICCTSPAPRGKTIMPPGFNWSISF